MTDSARLRLLGAGTTRTLRPVWAACELGIQLDHVPLGSRTGETQTDEFTALHPGQKIPVLIDGDFVLPESGAIVNYLSDRHGNGQLTPAVGSQARARYDAWASYVLMELDAHTLYILRKHEGLPEIYGEAPVAVEAARKEFSKQIHVAEKALAGGGPYLLGESFSGVDILLGSCLDWATVCEFDLPGVLPEYHARLRSREAYTRAFDLNYRTRPEISPFL